MQKTSEKNIIEIKGRKFDGVVVSDKMQKTVVVAVKRFIKHPKYGKFINITKRFKAHNEVGAKEGDKVTIGECRPMSKDKNFVVVSINK